MVYEEQSVSEFINLAMTKYMDCFLHEGVAFKSNSGECKTTTKLCPTNVKCGFFTADNYIRPPVRVQINRL